MKGRRGVSMVYGTFPLSFYPTEPNTHSPYRCKERYGIGDLYIYNIGFPLKQKTGSRSESAMR